MKFFKKRKGEKYKKRKINIPSLNLTEQPNPGNTFNSKRKGEIAFKSVFLYYLKIDGQIKGKLQMSKISTKDIILSKKKAVCEFVLSVSRQKFDKALLITSLHTTRIINRCIPPASSLKNPLSSPTRTSFWLWPNKTRSLDTQCWLTPIRESGGLIWEREL